MAALLIGLAPALAAPQQASADGACTASGATTTCTFTYTGGAQSWTVPAKIVQVAFDVYGAQGGAGATIQNQSGAGGAGGGEATRGRSIRGRPSWHRDEMVAAEGTHLAFTPSRLHATLFVTFARRTEGRFELPV